MLRSLLNQRVNTRPGVCNAASLPKSQPLCGSTNDPDMLLKQTTPLMSNPPTPLKTLAAGREAPPQAEYQAAGEILNPLMLASAAVPACQSRASRGLPACCAHCYDAAHAAASGWVPGGNQHILATCDLPALQCPGLLRLHSWSSCWSTPQLKPARCRCCDVSMPEATCATALLQWPGADLAR